MKIRVANDRTVFPSSIKIANQYESDTRTIDFDLSKVEFHGNAYLVLKYRASSEYFTPLLIGESMSIPVKTFMSAKEGTYDALIAISTVEISEDYDFSQDNPMFISNVFQVIVEDNFLSGTEQDWALTPAAQNYFDQLIALVEKVQSDLDSGAFVGNGIQSITKISTSGLVDTYQITFTNRSTFEYQVTNGQNGQTPTITIQDGYWYINGVNTGQQAQGEKGDKGDKGDTGDTGPQGDDGDPGQNATIAIGTVTTLEPDQEATVQNTGTETNAVLSFGIPKGVQGDIGPQGPQGAPGVNENVLHSDIIKSENPSVDDAYEAPLRDLKLYGKSTQVSTTGANLFDKETITDNSYISNDTGLVINDNEQILVASDYISVDGLSNIYIADTDKSRWGAFYNSDKEYISGFIATGSINVPENAKYLRFTVPKTNIDTFMINAGTQALPYEPYTGGKPSPSPDYPQEITCIEEVDCFITGANLFDISTSEDGSIKDGQETALQGYKRSDYIPVTPGGTISRTPQYITGTAGDFFYDIDKNFLTNINNSSSSSTIAVPENAYYYRFVFRNTVTELMVNVGETLLPYEPYQSQHVQFTPPAPLYSLLDGSVADYVDVARGKYVYQLTDVTFDGSEDESWVKNGSTPTYGYQITINDILPVSSSTGNDIMSKQFRAVSSSTTSDIESGEFRRGGGGNENKILIFKYDGLSTDDLDGWKAFVQSNNISVFYQLATPTEQDIPAETLEALQALKTFNGVTNIFCNAPVSAQYEQSVQIVMNKILEQLNKLQTQTLNLQEEMINNV